MSHVHPRILSRYVASFWVVLALTSATLPGCYQEPNRFDKVQQETRGKAATSKEAIAGGEFNKFFPRSEGDYSVVFTQEKRGFAEVDVSKGGEVVATIAMTDTVSVPATAEKFKDATEAVDGCPMVDVGSQGTAVLVADRIQVQVRSKDANVDKDARIEWIKKVDLANLAQMVRLQ